MMLNAVRLQSISAVLLMTWLIGGLDASASIVRRMLMAVMAKVAVLKWV